MLVVFLILSGTRMTMRMILTMLILMLIRMNITITKPLNFIEIVLRKLTGSMGRVSPTQMFLA